MTKRTNPILILAGLLVVAGALPAAPGARPALPPPALTKAPAPPVIDGVLDDPAWAAGTKYDGFKTFKPDYGKEASQKTEADIYEQRERVRLLKEKLKGNSSREAKLLLPIADTLVKRSVFMDDWVYAISDAELRVAGLGALSKPVKILPLVRE